jgi:hypothetical protein
MEMKRVLSVLLIMFVLMAPLASHSALSVKDKDLMLYLPFNEGKGKIVTDLSQNAFQGDLVGTVNWVDGKLGKALEFTEAGEVKCPYIALDNRSFSICLWTSPKLKGASEQVVFSQTQANNTNTSMHFRIYTNATVRMGFYSNDLDAAGAAKADEWQHICYWLDVKTKTRRIYINGEQVAQDQGMSPYLGTAGDTMIGSWAATGQKYNGMVDEVQIWYRALSPQEVKDSMNDMTKLAVESNGKLAATWGDIKVTR